MPKTNSGLPKEDMCMIAAIAEQMHERLLEKYNQGYSGWEICPIEYLHEQLLIAALDKRYVDVANYAGMLSCRKETVK